ncbi:MAG: hypothetical protein K6B41_01440 [Butyrivibrio sp.]|nr:hypothetical protein [Butyrivibrio sp.]
MYQALKDCKNELFIRMSYHKNLIVFNIIFGLIIMLSANAGWCMLLIVVPIEAVLMDSDIYEILPLTREELKYKKLAVVLYISLKYMILRLLGRILILSFSNIEIISKIWNLHMIKEHTGFMVVYFLFSIVISFELGMSTVMSGHYKDLDSTKKKQKVLYSQNPVKYILNLLDTIAGGAFYFFGLSLTLSRIIKIGNYDHIGHHIFMGLMILVALANIYVNIKYWEPGDVSFTYIENEEN